MSFDKVKEIIRDTISCSEESIRPEASLKDDMGIDSLDAMELAMALEEEFSIKIEEEELQKFVTVQDIVDFIDAKLA